MLLREVFGSFQISNSETGLAGTVIGGQAYNIKLFVMKNLRNHLEIDMSPGSGSHSNKPHDHFEGDSSDSKQGESGMLRHLYNCGRFFFLIPFRVGVDETSGEYYIRSNIFQRIFSFILYVILLAVQIYYIVTIHWRSHSEDYSSVISTMFDYMANFAAVILTLLLFKLYWLEKPKVLELLEHIRISLDEKVERKIKPTIYLIVLFTSLLHIWQEVNYGGGLVKLCRLHEPMYISFTAVYENSTFTNESDHYVIDNSSATFTTISKGILTRLFIIVAGNAFALFSLNQYQFIWVGLSLQKIGRDFRQYLEENREDVKGGIDAYQCLKERVEGINKILGNALLCYYFTSLCYLVMGPDIFLGIRCNCFPETVMLSLFLINSLSFWIITADYHYRAQQALKGWLEYQIFGNPKAIYCEEEVRMRIGSMKCEAEGGFQGLAVATKYFGITNKFLGTVLGLVVTYTIIIFQMQHRVK